MNWRERNVIIERIEMEKIESVQRCVQYTIQVNQIVEMVE
jgi:hypothetical protein